MASTCQHIIPRNTSGYPSPLSYIQDNPLSLHSPSISTQNLHRPFPSKSHLHLRSLFSGALFLFFLFLLLTMASLQRTPTALSLQFNFLPSRTIPRNPLTLKLVGFPRHRGGSSGIRMSATVANSYAVALADVAKSNNTLDSTSVDIEKIEKVFADKEVFNFFTNPTVDIAKKRQLVDDISKSSSLQPHTENFLNILIDAKRVDAIKDIVKEFESVYNELTDTELAVVSSVVQLESDHLTQIAKQVQKLTGAKNVRIKTVIDPSLVAGFTIRYGNGGSKLIDMSVKKQLEEIAAQLDLGDIQLAV